MGGPGRPSLARLLNCLTDRVEVVRADARRVRLPRVFDVVVSESTSRATSTPRSCDRSPLGGTHWLPTLLPVGPLPAGPGRLDVEIDWNPGRRRWSVRFAGDRGAHHAAAHDPLFVWGVVRPAIPGRR